MTRFLVYWIFFPRKKDLQLYVIHHYDTVSFYLLKHPQENDLWLLLIRHNVSFLVIKIPRGKRFITQNIFIYSFITIP